MQSSLRIEALTHSSDIEALQRFRYQVWSAEGADISDPENGVIADAHDQHACHWGVYDGAILVGSARLCVHAVQAEAPDAEMFVGVLLPCPVASLNRLVVRKSHRGLGIGQLLDDVRMKQAEAMGARSVIGTPVDVVERRRSLEKRGFSFIPDVVGRPIWSPTLPIKPCYLIFSEREYANAR